MKRTLILTGFLCLMLLPLRATHNRAGEITLTRISELTYEIKITTFTYSLSLADRDYLEVQWGDNTYSYANRTSKISLPNYYQQNVYITQHTFPGPGVYEIVVQDPNRNDGVKNIPNSVNVIFSIKTTILINPALGDNSTPVLLNPPIDRAAYGQIFIHNPAAYDEDGDSISYKLTVCTEKDGKPIEGYTLPPYSDTLYVHPYTGDLTWITPSDTGWFNIAMDVEEWRSGVKIGNIVRDMQIEVYTTDNNPPIQTDPGNYCIQAGEVLELDVIATDPDMDSVKQWATGGPFVVDENPATYTVDWEIQDIGFSRGSFRWETSPAHVRKQYYTVVFKAEDSNPETPLVDLKNMNIKVLGPAPESPELIPASSSITLAWEPDTCEQVSGYEIYRSTRAIGYAPDTCRGGVPSSTGYVLAGETEGRSSTFFVDNGGGQGLEQGHEYCYMLVSIYPDGAPSFPSAEVCSPLVEGTPSLLECSVTSLAENGSIRLSWAQPRGLDTIPANGPYEYEIYRSPDLLGGSLSPLASFITSDLADTTWTDSNVNTLEFPWSYRVDLYNNEVGNRFLIGQGEIASSMYPELVGSDQEIHIEMVKNVPWINYDYSIFRENTSGGFDSIGYSTDGVFVDRGLLNGVEYCYRVRSTGWRILGGQLYENSNWSHLACTIPVDSIPPCPPGIEGYSACDSSFNQVTWGYEDKSCALDVVSYRLYYTPSYDQDLSLLAEFTADDTVYRHFPEHGLAACYEVTAIDSFGNESAPSMRLCLDECSGYDLPNVFSPNQDGVNDIYRSLITSPVEKVEMTIFSRQGVQVFYTEDPDINWDGKDMNSGKLVAPGVYYYVCLIYEQRLSGLEPRAMTNFIYVFSGDENEVPIDH